MDTGDRVSRTRVVEPKYLGEECKGKKEEEEIKQFVNYIYNIIIIVYISLRIKYIGIRFNYVGTIKYN